MSLHLTASINIGARQTAVWKALTDKELIRAYFFGTDANSAWTEGSPVRFTGTYNGKPYEDKGTVLKVDPERLLQYEYWSSFWGAGSDERSVITYEIAPGPGGETQLTVEQQGFKDEKSRDGSREHWKAVLKTIKSLLEKP